MWSDEQNTLNPILNFEWSFFIVKESENLNGEGRVIKSDQIDKLSKTGI